MGQSGASKDGHGFGSLVLWGEAGLSVGTGERLLNFSFFYQSKKKAKCTDLKRIIPLVLVNIYSYVIISPVKIWKVRSL